MAHAWRKAHIDQIGALLAPNLSNLLLVGPEINLWTTKQTSARFPVAWWQRKSTQASFGKMGNRQKTTLRWWV